MKVLFSVLIFLSFKANASDCIYKVKEGDWIAKILRDLGSKDPFKDQSYFETLKINKGFTSLDKLIAGDEIKIPPQFLSEETKEKLCSKSIVQNFKTPKPISKKVTDPNPKKTELVKIEKKPQKDISIKKIENKKRLSASKPIGAEDSFPVLEYDAAVPKGGAK